MNFEEDLMRKASWYYYFEGLTQIEIANVLGINRIKVIKLLEKARETGIIQFKLREDCQKKMELETKLIKKFKLDDAFIVPSSTDKSRINSSIAKGASVYINNRLNASTKINIGYGDTQNKILNNLATMAENLVTYISLTGGVSFYLPNTQSSIFNAKLHIIPAPLIASTSEMSKAIMQETSVKEISRLTNLANLTIVGIGSMHESATIFKNGIISKNDFEYLKMQGAVGDILCHFIDKNGDLIQTSYEEKLISTPLSKLKELKNVIGVAAGDKKVEAIHAVLKGQYLNVLITDDSTAEKILEL